MVRTFLFLGLAACGSAQLIHQDQTGGIIELSANDSARAMEQANQLMTQHCGPNNFTITSKGYDEVGTETYTQKSPALDDKPTSDGRHATPDTATAVTRTHPMTAWRVHYACGSAGQP